MTEEQFCYEQIRKLNEEYRLMIKPYVDRLVYIKSLEAPKPFFVDVDKLSPDLRKKLMAHVNQSGDNQ